MADRSFVTDNEKERRRLTALVGRLSDQDLGRPMNGGWTVASVLAHLAFWDERVVVLLDQWGADGRGTAPRPNAEADVNWINDAGKPLCLALPPRVAANLAVKAAEAADGRLAGLSDGLLAALAAAGGPIRLSRADHRREHLDEIESALRA